MQLPMDTMVAGINALPSMLADTQEAGTQAAEAIMTTDTRSKQVAVTVDIKGKKVTVGGMCKGFVLSQVMQISKRVHFRR